MSVYSIGGVKGYKGIPSHLFYIAIKVFHVIKDKIRTYDLGFTLRPRNENKLKIASLIYFMVSEINILKKFR